jgi:hypothetical protein
MITRLSAQSQDQDIVILCESSLGTAAKHAAACENARKAYLRTMHGRQPFKGRHFASVKCVSIDDSIATVEVFYFSGSPMKGMLQLPISGFKQDGKPFTSSAEMETVVHRLGWVVVADRRCFDGIYLSNVTAVEFDSSSQSLGVKSVQPETVQK